MIHSDNKGVVLPPKVAQTQVVIIPVIFKTDDPTAMKDKAHKLAADLRGAGIRVKVDDSDIHNPGFKYNSWEVKGTPMRLELGGKDFAKNEVRCCLRHNGEKMQLAQEGLAT